MYLEFLRGQIYCNEKTSKKIPNIRFDGRAPSHMGTCGMSGNNQENTVIDHRSAH